MVAELLKEREIAVKMQNQGEAIWLRKGDLALRCPTRRTRPGRERKKWGTMRAQLDIMYFRQGEAHEGEGAKNAALRLWECGERENLGQ